MQDAVVQRRQDRHAILRAAGCRCVVLGGRRTLGAAYTVRKSVSNAPYSLDERVRMKANAWGIPVHGHAAAGEADRLREKADDEGAEHDPGDALEEGFCECVLGGAETTVACEQVVVEREVARGEEPGEVPFALEQLGAQRERIQNAACAVRDDRGGALRDGRRGWSPLLVEH